MVLHYNGLFSVPCQHQHTAATPCAPLDSTADGSAAVVVATKLDCRGVCNIEHIVCGVAGTSQSEEGRAAGLVWSGLRLAQNSALFDLI